MHLLSCCEKVLVGLVQRRDFKSCDVQLMTALLPYVQYAWWYTEHLTIPRIKNALSLYKVFDPICIEGFKM